MDDRVSALEQRIDQLTGLVSTLEDRIRTLEEQRPVRRQAVARQVESPVGEARTDDAGDRLDTVSALGVIGRLFIAVGGGYLLRAATEAGTLSPAAGIAIGFVYALGWLVAADRTAPKSRWTAAGHGLAAVLVGVPLLWEATTRFKVLTPAAGALVLALLVTALLAVAWRRRLQTLAWVPVLAACVVSLVLIAGTGEVVPFALVLIALGTATLWMGYSLDWVGLRWPVAILADFVVSALTMRALAPEAPDSAVVSVGVQVLLVAAYLGSTGIRTLVRGRNVVPFEVVQTGAVLLVGFGGALAVARATGSGVGLLGTICLAFGIASYAVAWWFVSRRPGLVRNAYFYTSVAIVFVLAGSSLLWSANVRVPAWAALAVVAAWLWARAPRFFVLVHAALYLMAAAVTAGAYGFGMRALFGAPDGAWSAPSWAIWLTAAAGAAGAMLATRAPGADAPKASHVPRALIVLTLVWTLGGILVGTLAPLVASAGGAIDPGRLATLRTSILALSALGVAYLGSCRGCVEWSWLVYPLLVVTGAKMVMQDFGVSRPSTLFVALALYGLALIVAPRLRRRPTSVGATTAS
jgi:hypothetical protein